MLSGSVLLPKISVFKENLTIPSSEATVSTRQGEIFHHSWGGKKSAATGNAVKIGQLGKALVRFNHKFLEVYRRW